MLRFATGASRRLSRAARDENGASAIEFAILAPVLIVILVASTEITQAVMAARRAATVARTVADLTSQIKSTTPLTTTMVNDIVAASGHIMSPFPATSLSFAISRVDVTNVNNVLTARTRWSVSHNNGARRQCGVLTRAANTAAPSPGTFPAGMHYAGRFIVADVRYVFAAPLLRNFALSSVGASQWSFVQDGIEVRRTAYMQMRMDGAPTWTRVGACP